MRVRRAVGLIEDVEPAGDRGCLRRHHVVGTDAFLSDEIFDAVDAVLAVEVGDDDLLRNGPGGVGVGPAPPPDADDGCVNRGVLEAMGSERLLVCLDGKSAMPAAT